LWISAGESEATVDLTVKHRELALVCKLLATVAPSRAATMPILETVRLKSTGTHVHLDALRFVGDHAVQLRVTLDLPADPGVLAVRLKDLREAIKGGSRYDDVTLHVLAGIDRLEVTGAGVKGGRLRLADPADWPKPIGGRWRPWVTLPGSAVPWLGAVGAAAAAEDDTRVALTGVQLRTNAAHGTLTATTTNSYLLHTVTKTAKEVAAAAERLVPAAAVRALAETAGLLEDARRHHAELTCTIEHADAAVRVAYGPITLTATTISAAFPNWEQLIPEPGTREGEVAVQVTDPGRLVDLLDTLPKQLLDPGVPLRLTFADGGATGEVHAQVGAGNGWTVKAAASLPLNLPDTAAGTVAYNPLLLRDLLAAGATGWRRRDLTFHVIPDGLKPALLTDGDGFRGLLMPVRLPTSEATNAYA
jgi:DNA polymerase III beta subunit, central domain